MARAIVSVLLPTVRPHLLQRSLASIGPAAGALRYEVIVVADFEEPPVNDPYVTWVQRPRRGVVDALIAAHDVSQGEYIFSFNDESQLEALALQRLFDVAVECPRTLLTPRHIPKFPFFYYGLPFAPFPFASRRLISALGGLVDPAYRAFYSDPDLSMRAHAAGVPVQVVEDAVIHHANHHDKAHVDAVNAYVDADRATFRAKWDHLERRAGTAGRPASKFRDP